MRDTLTVNALTGAPLSMDANVGKIAEGNHLMVARGKYLLAFDRDGVPRCTVTALLWSITMKRYDLSLISEVYLRKSESF